MTALLFSLAFSGAAFADQTSNWSLGGGIGQSFPTGPRTFFEAEKATAHGSIWIRRQWTSSFGLELNYNRINFAGKDGATDAILNGYTLNGVWQAPISSKWSWLAAIGAGLGEVSDYSAKKYSALYVLARLGAEYSLTPNLGLGLNAQANYVPEASSAAPSEIHSLGYLVSLNYAFGAGQEAESQPAEKASSIAPVATAAPVAAKDSDGDGVLDSDDKCADSAKGAKVNAYGCLETEKAQIRLNLNFAPGKAVVTDDQLTQIEGVAKFMKQYPATKVQIEGHTDKTGSEAVNKKLSKARATAVMNALVSRFSIEASRLRAEGYGSSQPIGSNDTEEGRKNNRRVIATISGQ